MPFVTQFWPPPFQHGSVGRAKFLAQIADRFVREENAAKGHHQLDIPQTQGEVEVQPDALGNDLFRESVTAIEIDGHQLRISSARLDNTR